MLVRLSVRDLVLIDALDLELNPGLSVLTGETGAGKSIILDALGLCLGGRADTGLIRPGADRTHATAEFEVPDNHPARALAREQGLDADGVLILRRQVGRDGRSRATLNDQSVSVALMRQLGDLLVEIQGQNDRGGLLDPGTHRGFLDDFAGLGKNLGDLSALWERARAAAEELDAAEQAAGAARADEEYLRHALGELNQLAPKGGEDAALADERILLRGAEKLAAALDEAVAALAGEAGPTGRLAAAERTLGRVAADAMGKLDVALSALARAIAEAGEAEATVESAARELVPDPNRLERVEERLFALRAAARKYRVDPDGLAPLRETFATRLAAIDGGDARLAALRRTAEEARAAYDRAAAAVSAARRKAATGFDRAVNAELQPLKLGKAVFETVVEAGEAGPKGADRVWFQVRTNPGHPPGALHKIASGGELGRFLLAVRVVLAQQGAAPVLVFDEIDRGIGGATADAVGERIARLAQGVRGKANQVLVITHSPQVAARANWHWRIEKTERGGTAIARVVPLDAAARREELARMLAGATVTEEARAAADRLMAGADPR